MSVDFSFTWVDYSIFTILFISMLISFLRGFIKEAISLVVWLAAIIIALKFATPLGNLFQADLHSETMRFAISFIALFIAVILVGMVVNAIIRALLDKSGLSIVDRLLGVIFGFARGILLVSMVLMFVHMSALSDNSLLKQSWSIQRLQPFVNWLNSFVPAHVDKVSHWISKDVADKQTVSESKDDQSSSAGSKTSS